jgi:hypothetical protein
MNGFTWFCIVIGLLMLSLFLFAGAEEADEQERQEQAARAERYHRFRQWQADHQLMRDMRDATFDVAAWYGRIEDLREAQ